MEDQGLRNRRLLFVGIALSVFVFSGLGKLLGVEPLELFAIAPSFLALLYVDLVHHDWLWPQDRANSK